MAERELYHKSLSRWRLSSLFSSVPSGTTDMTLKYSANYSLGIFPDSSFIIILSYSYHLCGVVSTRKAPSSKLGFKSVDSLNYICLP
jgi:hypothetical protein